jgi:hypothetical protein
MRTKTLLLTAALSAAGIATSMAQVYSVNAVGYVNTSLIPGFNLISNPLDNKSSATGNSVASIFGDQLVNGGTVYKYNTATSSYTVLLYDPLGGWAPAAATTLVPPGEGVFVRVNAATTVTFVGDVPQGSLSVNIPVGFSIRASQVPQEGNVVAAPFNFPARAGDTIYQFLPAQTYQSSVYEDLSQTWSRAVNVKVGEAFFVRATAARDWTRTFNVNQ